MANGKKESQSPFRQQALEYIATPKAMDDFVQVTPPFGLGAGSRFVVDCGGIYSVDFFWRCCDSYSGKGVVLTENEAILYVSALETGGLHPGVTVHISPGVKKQWEYKRISGKVTSIENLPATPGGNAGNFKKSQPGQLFSSIRPGCHPACSDVKFITPRRLNRRTDYHPPPNPFVFNAIEIIIMQWKQRLKKIIKRSHRERTPAILQMDSAECGAVALAIIMAYFGRYVPLSEVREACDVSRDGSKAINIIKAARRYNMDAHGLQLTMDNVQLLPPPFIIYWQFNHFLIVEGFEGERVYLNDPATGPRTETIEEFSRSFTGVALFMTPDEAFRSGGKAEPGIFKLLWQYLTDSRGSFFYIVFVALSLALPVAGLAFFTKIFLDNILLGGQRDWLPGLLLAMFGECIDVGCFDMVKTLLCHTSLYEIKIKRHFEIFLATAAFTFKFFSPACFWRYR